jgi:hypothetical protein
LRIERPPLLETPPPLDTALLEMFAQLEREVARFEGARVSASPALAVPILEGIFDRLTAVGKTMRLSGFQDAELEGLLHRQVEFSSVLRLASMDRGRLSLAVFRELLGSTSLPARERSKLLHDLAVSFPGLLIGGFARLVKGFDDEELRLLWKDTFDAFLIDLIAALDDLQR